MNYLIISNDLAQVVNFLTQIPDGGAHSSAYSVFLASDPCFYSAIWFPPLGNFVHAALPVFMDLYIISKWDTPYHQTAFHEFYAKLNLKQKRSIKK